MTVFILSTLGIAVVISGIIYGTHSYGTDSTYIDKEYQTKLRSLAKKFQTQIKIYQAEKSKYNAQKIRDISELILQKIGSSLDSVQKKQLENVDYDVLTQNINNLTIKETIDLVNNFLKTYKQF